MAKIRSEACELYITQEIRCALAQGKKPYEVGKELSDWVAKLFEVNIPHRTIEQRARRQTKDATNVANQRTDRKSENEPKPDPETIKLQARQFEQFVSLVMDFYDGHIDYFRNGEVNKTMIKKWETLMDLSPIIFEKPLGKK